MLQPAEGIGGYGFCQGVHLQADGAVKSYGGGAVLGRGYDQQAAFSSEIREAIISPVGVRMVRGFQSWLPGIPARAEKGICLVPY